MEDYDKSLSKEALEDFEAFFENLDTANRLGLKKVMGHVDLENRWIYKGSTTFPPCDRFVYWNVAEKIYPVPQAFIDKFKAKLAAQGMTKNYREIQRDMNLDVAFVSSGALSLVSSALLALLSIYVL